ncbi:hypothetical protein RJT34_20031 [Clitoria ternatea]|uniref:Uncharacterized protein n=1 Tax=Clitoria ternatea TaxID=43366 RepID=A0AAN9ISG2_CLITE
MLGCKCLLSDYPIFIRLKYLFHYCYHDMVLIYCMFSLVSLNVTKSAFDVLNSLLCRFVPKHTLTRILEVGSKASTCLAAPPVFPNPCSSCANLHSQVGVP